MTSGRLGLSSAYGNTLLQYAVFDKRASFSAGEEDCILLVRLITSENREQSKTWAMKGICLRVVEIFFFLQSICNSKLVTTAATITETPKNVTALLGRNASFTCMVDGQQSFDESLLWVKLAPDWDDALGAELLSLNHLSRDVDKYLMSEKYTITVVGVTHNDTGTYECSMDDTAHSATLNLAVPPSSLDLTWSANRSVVAPGETLNMTCACARSRPAASLRWYKGGKDVTERVTAVEVTEYQDGFADTISVQQMTITERDEGAPFRCIADLADVRDVMETELVVHFDKGSTMTATIGLQFLPILIAWFCQ